MDNILHSLRKLFTGKSPDVSTDPRISFKTGAFGNFNAGSQLQLVESYKSFLEEKFGELLDEKSHTLSIEQNSFERHDGSAATKYKLVLNRSSYRHHPEGNNSATEAPAYTLLEKREVDYKGQLDLFLKKLGGFMYSYPFARSAVGTLYTDPIPVLLISSSSDAKASCEKVSRLMDAVEANLPDMQQQLDGLNKLSRYEIEGEAVARARENYSRPMPDWLKYREIGELSHYEPTSKEDLKWAAQYEAKHNIEGGWATSELGRATSSSGPSTTTAIATQATRAIPASALGSARTEVQ